MLKAEIIDKTFSACVCGADAIGGLRIEGGKKSIYMCVLLVEGA